MNESTTLGSYLRTRARGRGLTLRTISGRPRCRSPSWRVWKLTTSPGGLGGSSGGPSCVPTLSLSVRSRRRVPSFRDSGPQPPAEVTPVVPGALQVPQASAPVTTQGRLARLRLLTRMFKSAHHLSARERVARPRISRGGDSRVRLRCGRLEVAMAGPAHRRLLRNRCPVDGGRAMVALLSDEFGTVPIPRPPHEPAGPPTAGHAASQRRLQPSRLTERPRAHRDVQARAQ